MCILLKIALFYRKNGIILFRSAILSKNCIILELKWHYLI